MVGLPLWAVFAVAFGSPLLAFLGVSVGQWFARVSDRELEERSRREETMRTLRWAAELAASRDDDRVQLGRSQLLALTSSALVRRDERFFVSTALDTTRARSRERRSVQPGRTRGYHGRRRALRRTGMSKRVMISDLERRSARRIIELNDSLGEPTDDVIRRIAAAQRVEDYDDPHKPYAVTA